ncbi:TolC family protein [Methylosarcina fibrata]|uniref:TolC family protein n=1 Tax=Methylosarcina fibrata TaxID=105972 RepID=UPI00036B7E42|nr:TolC family protein [Methylosarcina fibrata]
MFQIRTSTEKALWVAIAWTAVGGGAYAETLRLSPEKAVEEALSNSSSLAGANASISSSELELQSAERGGFPTISAAVSSMYGNGAPYSFFSLNQSIDRGEAFRVGQKTKGGYASGALTVTVPVFKKGSLFNIDAPAVQQAEAEANKARADSLAMSDKVTIEVLQYYLGVLQAEDEVAIHQQTHDSQSKWLDYVRKRGQEGLAIKSEELAVETALATEAANLNIARRKKDLYMLKLNMAMGNEETRKLELAKLPDVITDVPPVQELLQRALNINGTIKSQEAELQLAKAELEDVKGESLPTVTFASSAIAANNIVDNNITSFYSVGLNVAMPIYDFGQKSFKQDAKEAAVIENSHKLEAAREALVHQIHGSYNSLQDAKEQMEVDKKEIAHAGLVEEESKDGYEKGFVGLDQVLEDESDTLKAKLKLIEDRYLAWANYYDVIITTGKFVASSR